MKIFSRRLLLASAYITFLFTVPAGAADAQWRFVVVSDTQGNDNGINAKIVRELVQAIVKENPACVIVPGDLVGGSTHARILEDQLRAWRREFMEPLQEKKIAVYPVRGNHEKTEDSNDLLAWNKVFSDTCALPVNGPRGETKTTYSFTVNNAFFAGMDHYSRGREHRMNLSWLEKQLKRNRQPHVFVFAHEPVYACAGTNVDLEGPGQFKADRDMFARMAVSAGGVCYFCGHEHWFDHAKVEALPGKWLHQFTTGTGGGPLEHWMKTYQERVVIGVAHTEGYGYLVTDINGDTVTLTMKTRSHDGSYLPIETFTYTISTTSPTTSGH